MENQSPLNHDEKPIEQLDTETKKCLQCGTEILVGRKDRIFCDGGCRAQYNYDHDSNNDPIVRFVFGKLTKNRKILLQLKLAEQATKVSRTQLTDLGFDFNYFTNIYKTEKGDLYYFCFDMGYLSINDRTYLLVKKDGYVPGG
jgi:hypothetical protein